MITIITSKNRFYVQVLVHLLCAMLVTWFIGYVDEGINDAYWMFHPGQWMPFVFYTAVYLCVQLLVRLFFSKGYSSWVTTFLSSLFGCFFFTVLLFWAFMN